LTEYLQVKIVVERSHHHKKGVCKTKVSRKAGHMLLVMLIILLINSNALISVQVGEVIGLEMYSDMDQFFRIEERQGIIKMGDRRDRLDFQGPASADYVILITVGKWAQSYQH